MIVSHKLYLSGYSGRTIPSGLGYRLYAALLENCGETFAQSVHQNGVTPISQHIMMEHGKPVWKVTLLGEESKQALDDLLSNQQAFVLKRDQVTFRVQERYRESIADVDQLFVCCQNKGRLHRLNFCTPTAFKHKGTYCMLPTTRLLLQSVWKQWNGCFPDCQIDDEDGQGLDMLADGLVCNKLFLRDESYHLKGNRISGFVGHMVLENRLSGFHQQLADVLLYFSDYVGIGIKTSLGMGGVIHSWYN